MVSLVAFRSDLIQLSCRSVTCMPYVCGQPKKSVFRCQTLCLLITGNNGGDRDREGAGATTGREKDKKRALGKFYPFFPHVLLIIIVLLNVYSFYSTRYTTGRQMWG
jgi:hypothetical protein